MHPEERLNSPTGRCTKRNDERDTGHATRRRALAPALEHRDQSNEEEQDGSGCQRFDQHVNGLRCIETDMQACRKESAYVTLVSDGPSGGVTCAFWRHA